MHFADSVFLCLLGSSLAIFAEDINAQIWHFSSSMIGNDANISFLEEGRQLPGVYTVRIKLNGITVDTRKIEFHEEKDIKGKYTLQPCLTVEQLSRYGIKVEDFFVKDKNTDAEFFSRKCSRLANVPNATAVFKFYEQELLLSIPQIALRPKYRTVAPESLWNNGISALLMNYDINQSWQEFRGKRSSYSDSSSYLQLRPGLNLGAWRLRNVTSWRQHGRLRGKWQSAYTRAERGLHSLKSLLSVGELSTSPDIFDSLPVRGIALATDEAMFPWEQRSFSPAIRGIAQTQARVEVRQQGYLIYSTTVAPGAFELTNLPVRSEGIMDVKVLENDGHEQNFRVSGGTPAIALKKGYLKYSLFAGIYRPMDTVIKQSPVCQTTVMYGLPLNLTFLGGGQVSKYYQSAAIGIGVLLGNIGAISVDTLKIRGRKYKETEKTGGMWRIRYSKMLENTGTRILLSDKHYTSTHYFSVNNVLNTWRKASSHVNVETFPSVVQPLERFTLTLSQPLGRMGYLNFSGERNCYHSGQKHVDSLNTGYSLFLPWGGSFSLNLSQTFQKSFGRRNRMISLIASVPLDWKLLAESRLSWQMTSSSGMMSQEESIYGSAFKQQMYWDIRHSTPMGPDSDQRSHQSLYTSWLGPYGRLGGSYSHSRDFRYMTASVSGGMVLHEHGLTFSQTLDDTVMLIEVPGASGVAVGRIGAKTDFRGYTALGQAIPYQKNVVSLDPATLPQNLDIAQTDAYVVPTKGAVVPVHFTIHQGKKALVTLLHPNGKPIPFGAMVVAQSGKNSDENNFGIIDDGGVVYLRGLPDSGQLYVQWGRRHNQHCTTHYQLSSSLKKQGNVFVLKETCV